ncbi:MAG TPA: hypothetical protein VG368_04585 [Acidimicrobiales bacterium]|jgi:predicted lipoprotein with Yx(FWY)xxD motif|nr:hypothetical protein [Acidimicrobiales bacterium]
MKQMKAGRKAVRARCIAITALAIGGAAGPIVAVGSVGAVGSHAATSLLVSTATSSKLGTILVSGRTLYTLRASKVSCATACLKIWPELVLPKGVKKATAGKGVTASKLGTVTRSGGVLQVTYASKPLYYFSGDKAAGQVHGNLTDTWGSWATVVTVRPSTIGGGNTGTGGVAF